MWYTLILHVFFEIDEFVVVSQLDVGAMVEFVLFFIDVGCSVLARVSCFFCVLVLSVSGCNVFVFHVVFQLVCVNFVGACSG